MISKVFWIYFVYIYIHIYYIFMSEIDTISKLLQEFIKRQEKSNISIEAKIFANQTHLSSKIGVLWDRVEELGEKIDDMKYFLEQTIAVNTDTLFDEDSAMRMRIVDLEKTTEKQDKKIYNLAVEVGELQKV